MAEKEHKGATVEVAEAVGAKGEVETSEGPDSIPVHELFRFADAKDFALMICGAICGCGTGVTLPLFSIILGDLFNDFQTSQGPTAIEEAGDKYARLFGWLALAAFIAGTGQVALFTIASERQTLRIRKIYLDALLRQEVAWFDSSKSGELSSKIAENTVIIREAMGEKLGALFQFGAMFVAGFVVGFVENWKLTLVIVAGAPLLATGGFIMMKVMSESTSGGLNAYAKAGGVAEEAFSMIRTVASFGIETRVNKRYTKYLEDAEAFGMKKAKGQGFGMGFTFCCYFLMYALAFWYGSVIVLDSENNAASTYPPTYWNATSGAPKPTTPYTEESLCRTGQVVTVQTAQDLGCVNNNYDETYTFLTNADVCRCIACNCGCYASGVSPDCVQGGDILIVFFAVVMGAFALGQAAPSISALKEGQAAAAKIYAIIARQPKIDVDAPGEKLENVRAHIKFTNVAFRYPSRPDALIFNNLNLEIKAGESVALVGGSGCGKSTVIQMVQRLYDPENGSITVDGTSIKELDLKWWRNCIGVVGQEPVLFATTIAKNIAYGAPDGVEVTREQIEQAAKAANAYNFITDLPDGFETFVGERGSSLSGGQKQRIAIARAIIRDPTLLILDEATSALDNESERIVQAALDDLLKLKKRTTITIAHRLSTIRNADKIVVLGDGGVLEQGNHDELMGIEGHYAALIAAAQRSQESGGEEADVLNLIEQNPEISHRLGSSELSASKRNSASHLSQSQRGGSKIRASTSAANIIDEEEEDDDVEDKQLPDAADGKKQKEKFYSVPISRVFQFSAPEKLYYIPALFAATVNGAVMPLFAILFSNLSNVYFYPTNDLIRENANEFSLYFVYLSIAVGICYFLQFYFFGLIAEKMTTRVRSALFVALLRQEVGYYDQKRNSVGALTSKLATDAALVKASVADRTSLLVMNVVTLTLGLVIAFIYGWELTLVLIALLPLIAIGGAAQLLVMGGVAKEDDKALAEAGQVLSESISGIRTVTAFGLRKKVVALYDSYLVGPSKMAVKRGSAAGLGFGFSQGILFAIYSIAFLYGSRLIVNSDYTFQDVINVFFAIVMAGFGMGQSVAMAPDVAKAKVSVSNVFRVLDRKSTCDPLDPSGEAPETVTTNDIEFKNVQFTYPSRPDAKILKDFSLKIKAGTTVALCGASGSGKSTGISLLERFYDADQGEVIFHGVDTTKANIGWLRSKFGFVQQEPQLFGTTIFENIAYGVAPTPGVDVDTLVTEEQVIAAAKSANAHDFIMSFPDGYQTLVGEKGSQLSGGQKQRICLARAIIRNPDVLLLDEATSALDNESERIVQETLDKLMADSNRTTIVIAHRLSTIQNADLIAVVDHGCLIEQGTHEELLAKDGAYAKLYKSQDNQPQTESA